MIEAAPVDAAPAPSYSLTGLPTKAGDSDSYAEAINDRGQIIGSSARNGPTPSSDRIFHPFLWDKGAFQFLPLMSRDGWNDAIDINNEGLILGTCASYGPLFRVFFWNKGRLRPLSLVKNSTNDLAWRLNNRGQAVCSSAYRSFIWEAGTMVELKSPAFASIQGAAINDAGQVAGVGHLPVQPYPTVQEMLRNHRTSSEPVVHAILWRGNKVTDLGTLPGRSDSHATAINSRGQVVGTSDSGEGAVNQNAFLWDQGKMTALGTLGGSVSEARSINDRGQVVGMSVYVSAYRSTDERRAVLWEGSRVYDLNRLIPAGSGWTLLEARDINNHGEIVGSGKFHGAERGFLLTPVKPK